MARIMEHVDGAGTTHKESFWTSYEYTINPYAKWARFLFVGFATQAAAAAGKDPLPNRIEASCDGATFERYMARHLNDHIPINVLAYELADEQGKFPGSVEA